MAHEDERWSACRGADTFFGVQKVSRRDAFACKEARRDAMEVSAGFFAPSASSWLAWGVLPIAAIAASVLRRPSSTKEARASTADSVSNPPSPPEMTPASREKRSKRQRDIGLLVLGVLVLGVLVATASEGTDSLKPTPPPGVRSKTAASGRKSKRLKVVLFATNANAYLCALLKSALLLSLDVHIIGWGLKPKPGGKPINNVISQTNAAWACKQRSDDLVMGLDAFDAFFTPKAVQKQTLRRRLSAMNASFVWSAETNMFPGFSAYAPSFERRYPSQSPTQYKFLNYGAWLGTGAAACRVMSSCAQQMRKCTLCKPAEAAGKTGWAWFDQHAAQYVLVDDQSTKQALDYQNELFHSGWPDCRDFNFSSYRLKGSGVAPHVLHLNGAPPPSPPMSSI